MQVRFKRKYNNVIAESIIVAAITVIKKKKKPLQNKISG